MNIQSLSKLIEDNQEYADFEGTKDPELVASAEMKLDTKFPPSYRNFLVSYGCGDIAGVEIYGVIDNNFINSSIPDGIWATLNAREKYKLPHRFIIIGSTGDGYWYALDSSQPDKDGEYPVGICGFGENNEGFEKTNDNFAEYLFEQITLALEDQD